MYDIGIAFQSGHEGCFEQGSMEVVPFLSFSVTSIFAGKYFRSFAVIVIIACSLTEEPAFGTVEVFVYQISFQTFHLRPQVIEFFSFGVRAGTAYNHDFRMCLAKSLDKRFETFGILFSPLFVTDAQIFQIERCRMSHIGTYFPPSRVHVSVGKFDQIKCILNIAVQIANCYVSFFFIVLILTGKPAVQDRKRCRSHFFRKKEILIESQSVALIIIRIETMGKSILPAIFVQWTVFYRAHGFLPVITGFEIRTFNDATTGKTENSRMNIRQSLRKVFAKTVLMPLPCIDREKRNMLQVYRTLGSKENTKRCFGIGNTRF